MLIVAVLKRMVSSLEDKAKLYYGGDLSIRGAMNGGNIWIKDDPLLRKAVRDFLGLGPVISDRFEHHNTSTMLYFGGEGLR